MRGVEAALRAPLPHNLALNSSATWTFGEAPLTCDHQAERGPHTRIPPLNGSAELSWWHIDGLELSAAMRWATGQQRLSLADRSDPRIPGGGTPGFVVADLRMTYEFNRAVTARVAVENVFDSAYRYHGSSINGPGRGVVGLLDFDPLFRTE